MHNHAGTVLSRRAEIASRSSGSSLAMPPPRLLECRASHPPFIQSNRTRISVEQRLLHHRPLVPSLRNFPGRKRTEPGLQPGSNTIFFNAIRRERTLKTISVRFGALNDLLISIIWVRRGWRGSPRVLGVDLERARGQDGTQNSRFASNQPWWAVAKFQLMHYPLMWFLGQGSTPSAPFCVDLLSAGTFRARLLTVQ